MEPSEFEVNQGEDEVTSHHPSMTGLLGAPTSFLCVGVTPYNDGALENAPSLTRKWFMGVFGYDGTRERRGLRIRDHFNPKRGPC